jgi:hypothetical protein
MDSWSWKLKTRFILPDFTSVMTSAKSLLKDLLDRAAKLAFAPQQMPVMARASCRRGIPGTFRSGNRRLRAPG